MPFFGSSWNDDYDDEFETMGMAIGGATKEDIKREREEEEIRWCSHWDDD